MFSWYQCRQLSGCHAPLAVMGKATGGDWSLEAEVATRPGHRCHSVPSQDHSVFRFPKPAVAHLSDTEAQRGEAISIRPQSKQQAEPTGTQGPTMPDLHPPHLTDSKSAGGQTNALWKGPLNLPLTKRRTEIYIPLKSKATGQPCIFCPIVKCPSSHHFCAGAGVMG